MDWTQLSVTVDVSQAELAAAIMQMVAPGGISVEDYSDLEEQAQQIAHTDLIDEALLNKDRSRAVLRMYLSPETPPAQALEFLHRRLEASRIPFTLAAGEVREQDWANEWKRYYHAITLSRRLLLCPSWEPAAPEPGQKVLWMDPGMAFGTGTHETTRLCIAELERRLSPGDRVLDVGCGSGILAICAKLLGSARTVGVDIDATAVKTARENARRNDCADIQFIQGDLAEQVHEQFDIICANLTADIIRRLLPSIPALLDKGGAVIFSGIIEPRAGEIQELLPGCGLAMGNFVKDNGWAAMTCLRAGEES
jgi:ribosomal protein L11 methyltransferase